MKYLGAKNIQYIIMANEFDYSEQTYSDLFPYENFHYFKFPLVSSSLFKKRLSILHGSQVANRFINLPFQGYWNKYAFRHEELDRSIPACLIYSPRRIDRFIRSGFFEYVKQYFPRVFNVVYWDDLVKPTEKRALNYVLKYFDLAFSYDIDESKAYGLRYYPSFYSKMKVGFDQENQYDICFVGQAKNRLDDIYRAYNVLAREGASCKFVINGVSKEQQRSLPGISYDVEMSYEEVIRLVQTSKCILEIVQRGSSGQSLRVNEAFVLNKCLLSNNPNIKTLPQFDSRYMRVFSDHPTSADVQFVKENREIHYPYPVENVSPIKFIEKINELLRIDA